MDMFIQTLVLAFGNDKSLNEHVPFNAAITGEFESELQHKVNTESSYTIFSNNYSSKGTKFRELQEKQSMHQPPSKLQKFFNKKEKKKRCSSFFFGGWNRNAVLF